jgi:hypothetical protein
VAMNSARGGILQASSRREGGQGIAIIGLLESKRTGE